MTEEEKEKLWEPCVCGCGERIKFAFNLARWLPESVWTGQRKLRTEERVKPIHQPAALNEVDQIDQLSGDILGLAVQIHALSIEDQNILLRQRIDRLVFCCRNLFENHGWEWPPVTWKPGCSIKHLPT
jgi:hypothetical protein